jgi:hypothetical protein
MRIGILELLLDNVTPSHVDAVFGRIFRRQLYSIMPQAIAVWCRELGHDVSYATYYGQSDPVALLPDDLDLVFISAYTQASSLANALGRFYRSTGVVTVIGGPHAKAFPEECLRFFDIVVGECDKNLIGDILRGHISPRTSVSSQQPAPVFPSVEERAPDLAISALHNGRATRLSIISVLSSVGCPYKCNFCTDWNSDYRPVSATHLASDLRFISKTYPKALLAFHDPNFAVRFDETMNVIEEIPAHERNNYVMESSLSILKEDRLPRLRETGCVYIAPGLESWADYGNKAGTGSLQGQEKLNRAVDHFEKLHAYVPGLQANLLFGTDCDRGAEPAQLTDEFMQRLPYVWPGINIPTPYGGTPLYESYLAEGRILKAMPISLYFAPYLVTTLKHYDPLEYYDLLIGLYETMTSNAMLRRRVFARAPNPIRISHVLRTFAMRQELAEQRRIREQLVSDKYFHAFHRGKHNDLPDYYHHAYESRLGRYAELIPKQDRIPLER